MPRIGALAGLGLVTALAFAACAQQGQAQAVACPARPGDPLQNIDVFDGPPEEQAYLVPDNATDERGSWSLAYVYNAGRFVTLRCKYGRGPAVDLKISQRIGQCQYARRPGGALSVTCN
jgi:hypothetical protein